MPKITNILLIEDDQFISDLYGRSLRKAGYHVDVAVTGPKGLALAKSGMYQLILLDIMIPDMTGIDVLKELRGNGDMVPNAKILVTTNLDQDDSSRQAMEAQADGYLIKADVTPKNLIQIIQQLEQTGLMQIPNNGQPATGPSPVTPPAPAQATPTPTPAQPQAPAAQPPAAPAPETTQAQPPQPQEVMPADEIAQQQLQQSQQPPQPPA